MDNVFGDLESVFNCLGSCIVATSCATSTLLVRGLLFIPQLISRILLFTILFVLHLVVIFPALFWILILRLGTIETKVGAFSARQEAIQKESRFRTGLRWGAVLFRGIPMSFYLLAVPILLSYAVLPTLNTEGTISCLGAYLAVILFLEVLATIRARKSEALRESATRQMAASKLNWLSFRNAMLLLSLLFETFQMLSWPLQQFKPASTDPPLLITLSEQILPKFFMKLSSSLADVAFFSTVGAVLFFLAVLTLQVMHDLSEYTAAKKVSFNETKAHERFFYSLPGAIIYGHGRLHFPHPILTGVIAFLSDGLFMTIAPGLLAPLQSTAEYDPFKTTLSLASFAYYVPLAGMLAPLFIRSSQDRKDVR
jgi:hypothetical protein